MTSKEKKIMLTGTGIIGVCPLLATSTTLLTASAMAALFLSVVFLSALSLSTCRHYISYKISLPLVLIINVSWVVVIDLLMQAYWYEMTQVLGIYLPLLAMNSFVLLCLQTSAINLRPIDTFGSISVPALAIAAMLVVLGGARELLAAGSLMSDASMLLGEDYTDWSLSEGGFNIFTRAPGGFLVFGFLLAARHLLPGTDVGVLVE